LKAFKFKRFLQREQIDVLQLYFPDSSIFGIFSGWLAGVPRIIRTRNNLGYWMTRKDRWIAKILNRFVHWTIANCEACRQAVIADEGVDPESVIVLENGIDLERFKNLPRDTSQNGEKRIRKVGMVANLRPVKDPETFVRAAAIVAAEHPDIHFEIAGEGELRPHILKLADELGLNGRFHLLGTVEDIPAFLSNLDVAVLTSQSEGMSNAILEYMAAGLPIVATDVGANAELIIDGISGTLIPPNNPIQLANALRQILNDPTLTMKLKTSAYQLSRERCNATRRSHRYDRLCSALIKNDTTLPRHVEKPTLFT
jgi:glycosyltransferase involved in cell wall biosynthesis